LEKNEDLKIIAQQFKKCQDCRKLMPKDIVESVLEKNNYVGIIVSLTKSCVKKSLL
jgi:hypothetical protein